MSLELPPMVVQYTGHVIQTETRDHYSALSLVGVLVTLQSLVKKEMKMFSITNNIPKAEGLTAIEGFIIVCIVFVFGALIGEFNNI